MKQNRANGKKVTKATWVKSDKVEVVYDDLSKATYDKKTFEIMHKEVK